MGVSRIPNLMICHPGAEMRRLLLLLGTVALVAVVVIGLAQTGRPPEAEREAPEFDLAQAKQQLQGAPAPLAALHEQSNTILAGGPKAFETRLAELEGHPAVINKWASWCRPCRAEFPIFQAVATERGKEYAFLGINSEDKRPAAEKFLSERPLPYPSYEDPDEEIAQVLEAPKYFPMTIFVDANGDTAFIKAGEYTSRAELEADIDKYLGGA
jgi:cytochrome c biogenesis protein CcmG, thiol:disulfide interchange protein DsbE